MASSSLDVDPRLLGRPSHFDGGEEEEEYSIDYSMEETYAELRREIDESMAGIMESSEASNRPIVMSELNAAGVPMEVEASTQAGHLGDRRGKGRGDHKGKQKGETRTCYHRGESGHRAAG